MVALAALALLLACFGDVAAARAPVGKDGKIHACYRVKGKPKGALRVVRSARARCRRGERKASWSVGSSPSVSTLGEGPQGPQGPAGSGGSSAVDEAALKAQVGALSLRVEALEGILQGVTNGGLLAAVAAVPAVESLCQQSETLTGQVNELGAGVTSLLSVLGGTLLGPIFGSVDVPAALEAFSCPTS